MNEKHTVPEDLRKRDQLEHHLLKFTTNLPRSRLRSVESIGSRALLPVSPNFSDPMPRHDGDGNIRRETIQPDLR